MKRPERASYLLQWSGDPDHALVVDQITAEEMESGVCRDLKQRVETAYSLPISGPRPSFWIRAQRCRRTPWGIEPIS